MSRTKTVSVEWRHKDSPPLKKRTLNLLHRKNAQSFCEFQGVLFFHFVIEQWTINTAYYSKLLKEGTQPQLFVQNDKDNQSKAAASCTTTRVRTPQQWQQGHWRKHVETLCCALSTLPLAPSDVHLFSPLTEALGQGWANFLWAGQMKKVKCQVGQLTFY
jgi:hypothetical protein